MMLYAYFEDSEKKESSVEVEEQEPVAGYSSFSDTDISKNLAKGVTDDNIIEHHWPQQGVPETQTNEAQVNYVFGH